MRGRSFVKSFGFYSFTSSDGASTVLIRKILRILLIYGLAPYTQKDKNTREPASSLPGYFYFLCALYSLNAQILLSEPRTSTIL